MHRPFRSQWRRFCADSNGAVAVEFALIAPILFTLLFGIAVLGYIIGINHSVNQLAAGAARVSVTGLDEAERKSFADAYLAEAGSRYPLLIADALTTSVAFDGGAPDGIIVTVDYAIAGSLLGVANGFLGLDVTHISGSAYLAY